MKYIIVYLKVFIVTAVPFGLFISLIPIIFVDVKTGIIIGLIAGLFFGGAMSSILSTMHIHATNKICNNKRTNKYSSRQKSIVKLTGRIKSYEEFKLNLLKNTNWTLLCEDKNNNLIKLKTDTSRKSFGEVISINVSINNELAITSKPYLFTTIIDYGKNLENVMYIEKLAEGVSIA